MKRQRGLIIVFAIILAVTLPTILSLTWHQITGDPRLRPLSITEENLRSFQGRPAGVNIVAIVDWDEARSGQLSQQDMQNTLISAFDAKGVDVYVTFRASGSGTFVTYEVGSSTIGPYPQNRAAQGIIAAVDAYRMNTPRQP